MPTPSSSFNAVAAAVGNVNAEYEEEVDAFFTRDFLAYPEAARELIAEFLIASVAPPTSDELNALADHVARIRNARRVASRYRD